MERERLEGPCDAEAETPAQRRSPSELRPLIAEAHSAVGEIRFEAAERINELLIALRAPGKNGLVDGKGRDCRKEAVETLLACGFPHALNVSPEDLAHARRPPTAPPSGRKPLHLVKLGGWVALLTAIWQVGTALNVFGFQPLLSVLLVAGAALTGIGGQWLTQLKAKDSLIGPCAFLAGGVLTHFGLLAIGLGGFPWIVAGASALSAALAAAGTRGTDGT